MEWAQQGQRLQAIREAAGISRHKLGVKVGRTSQTVLYWEQGRVRPPVEMVVQVGDVLDAKAELLELYGYTGGDASLVAKVREMERRLDEQAATIARLVEMVGLTLDTASQAAKPRRRPKS